MNLLDPGMLAWLAVFIPPLVLLYFLKLKRKEHPVTSIILWQRSIQDLRANSPFQRLRKNLLLFLQILVFVLVAAALARPVLLGLRISGSHRVLLIDQSASMSSKDAGGRTRLEAAIETAFGLIDDPDRENMMIIGFGSDARTYCSFTDSSVELRNALSKVSQLQTETRVDGALEVAFTALKGKTSGSVIVLSDGAFGAVGLKQGSEITAPVHFLRFGSGSANAGIVGIEAKREADGGGRAQVLAAVFSSFPGEQSAVAELRRDDRLVDAAEITLKPGTTVPCVFGVDATEHGAYTVRITPGGLMDADDEAGVTVEPASPAAVHLYSKGSFFLKKALEQDREIEVTVEDPDSYSGKDGGRTDVWPEDFPSPPDVVVFDGLSPSNRPAMNSLYLGCLPPIPGIVRTGIVSEPVVFDWNRTHPITRYAEFSILYVKESASFSMPETASALIEAKDCPLAACVSDRGVRVVWTGFNLQGSDWPVQVSFPVFLKNSISWLSSGRERTSSVPVKPGSPIALVLGKNETTARIIKPGGEQAVVERKGSGPLLFADTFRTGLYVAETAAGKRVIACNLASESESDITPKDQIEVGETRVSTGGMDEGTTKEVWRLAVLAAFILMALEWYVYHRKAS